MADATNIVSLAKARRRRAMSDSERYDRALGAQDGPPPWIDDIAHCCAYARLLKAEHAAERERIAFELLRDHGDRAWWTAPPEIQARVDTNNFQWSVYIALVEHIAALPATTRNEASNKRRTIGKNWLKPNPAWDRFKKLRDGCLADDHLFPPSLRLERLKGETRVS